MQLKKFNVETLPFEDSDVVAVYQVYGLDEMDALQEARKKFPRVKSVEEAK